MALTQTQVSELYVAIFNRASEGSGNDFWQGQPNTAAAADEMLATSDAQEYFGDSLDSDQLFIEHIYLNTFNKTLADDPEGIAFWVGKLESGESRGTVVAGIVEAASDPVNAGEAQDQFNNRVEVSDYTADTLEDTPDDLGTLRFDDGLTVTDKDSSVDDAKAQVDGLVPEIDGNLILLTADQDNITGSAEADLIKGYVFDNQNTLQSGDMVDGGEGVDTIEAQIGDSQNFAISAVTTNVERIIIEARADGIDSNDNNLQNDFVQIDAADMDGVTEWGTDGSRADVVIEDIRIQDDEVTEDILFSMRDTDPGSNADGVDGFIDNDTQTGASLHAYYDANSLRSDVTNTTTSLTIEILDIENELNSNEPLKDDTNNGFELSVVIDGVLKDFIILNEGNLGGASISDATNYSDLKDAIQLAFDQYPSLGAVVTLSTPFTRAHKVTKEDASGTSIVVEFTGEGVTGEVVPGDWLGAKVDQDTSVNIAADLTAGEPTQTIGLLITSDVVLDNVGRGSEGGDLEIGGMSTRGGVEKFDLIVEDSSWITNARSTNETLEVVTIVNSAESVRDTVNADGVISNGDLYIGSGLNPGNDLVTLRDDELHVDTNGLIDVRLVQASTFASNLKLGLSLTERSVVKYLHPIETETLGSEPLDTIDFSYQLGAGNDFINMDVYSDLAADSDFNLSINTNNGNDNVLLQLVDSNGDALAATWGSSAAYTSHATLNNITIDTGAGDDTVTTLGAGNAIIRTGSGNDTIYADNSGVKTVIVTQAELDANAVAAQATADLTDAVALAVISGADAVTAAASLAATAIADALVVTVTADVATLQGVDAAGLLIDLNTLLIQDTDG